MLSRAAALRMIASLVVVEGYVMDRPEAPGIELTGNNVTVRNNTITQPRDGDGDASGSSATTCGSCTTP